MMKVSVSDGALRRAATEGMDAFVGVFVDALRQTVGGELTTEALTQLSSNQTTLLVWDTLHTEMMDGGMIQLIHNGYGPLVWFNPTDKAFRLWSEEDGCASLRDLARLVRKSHALFVKRRADIERDCTDDEFMALYERMPEFDDYDDFFVSNEEEWTRAVATYIDNHIGNFAEIEE